MMCQADDGNLGEDGVAPEGALQSGDGGEAMERGEAYWTYDSEAGAWYFGLKSKAAPPYLTQRHFDAIVDLDAEGRLAGIELLQPLLPSRGMWSPRSPDEEAVPADTVSAASSEGSLTPQNHEAKAREIAFDIMSLGWRDGSKPGEIIFYDEQFEPELFSAISSALSTAFEEGKRVERERCIGLVNTVRWGYVTPSSPPYNRGYNSGADEMRQWIASAIRKEQTDDC